MGPLSPAAEFLGREPETDQDRAYVHRLASQELAEARAMRRGAGQYVLNGLLAGAALFVGLATVAVIIALSSGDAAPALAPNGPVPTIGVLASAFTAVQLFRAPFRSRRRNRRAQTQATTAALALAQVCDTDEDVLL
jgi:hypothetical protein